MSYLNKYRWELIPESLPKVKRICSKCNGKSHYINSGKFRVNANKNNIDVWMIYKCDKCKSTWNMTIHERVKPHEIKRSEYEKFLVNDENLIKEYAFNLRLYSKNKVEVILEDLKYKLVSQKIGINYKMESEIIIEIECKYPMDLRVDRLLSDKLGLSRSKIKSKEKLGQLYIKGNENPSATKIKNGMEIRILMEGEVMKALHHIV
ncbi:DUF1062 domain-containing protein [Clostridium intestinale]|uniref:DUF1062 domain-containing protein n=1 Tax=Clostridium intestinale URNW TaxID=1294142 RepID=U2MZA3_9CLOT|nr:DUF1062 domain-containing protein [Clostridium intestinale]ERK28552.1 hypothetical protein CINTURNW_4213 [Clostridium intestinale URNW]